MGREDWEKWIRRHYVAWTSHIDPREIIPHLRDSMTTSTLQRIDCALNNDGPEIAARRLMDEILRYGGDVILVFMTALRRLGCYKTLLCKVSEDMPEDLKREIDRKLASPRQREEEGDSCHFPTSPSTTTNINIGSANLMMGNNNVMHVNQPLASGTDRRSNGAAVDDDDEYDDDDDGDGDVEKNDGGGALANNLSISSNPDNVNVDVVRDEEASQADIRRDPPDVNIPPEDRPPSVSNCGGGHPGAIVGANHANASDVEQNNLAGVSGGDDKNSTMVKDVPGVERLNLNGDEEALNPPQPSRGNHEVTGNLGRMREAEENSSAENLVEVELVNDQGNSMRSGDSSSNLDSNDGRPIFLSNVSEPQSEPGPLIPTTVPDGDNDTDSSYITNTSQQNSLDGPDITDSILPRVGAEANIPLDGNQHPDRSFHLEYADEGLGRDTLATKPKAAEYDPHEKNVNQAAELELDQKEQNSDAKAAELEPDQKEQNCDDKDVEKKVENTDSQREDNSDVPQSVSSVSEETTSWINIQNVLIFTCIVTGLIAFIYKKR